MFSSFLIGFFLLACVSPAWATRTMVSTHPLTITKPTTFDGIQFPANSHFDMLDNGHVYYAWPGSDFEANGIKILKETQMMLHGNGKVQAIWTVPGQKIMDIELPPKTWTTFRKDGSLDVITLQSPLVVRKLKLDHFIEFYRNGSFKKVSLAENQIVDDLLIKKGDICFHPNGKLMSGYLVKDTKLSGISNKGETQEALFLEGTRLYRNEKGLVVGAFSTKSGSTVYTKELYPQLEDSQP